LAQHYHTQRRGVKMSILLLAIILVLLAFIYEENRGDSR